MSYNNIKFEKDGVIGILTISRPKALNALNTETVTELNDCVGKIEQDPEVKVVIITGEGSKSFVAGADIVEMSLVKSLRIHSLVSKTSRSRLLQLLTATLSAVAANSLALATSGMLLKTLNSVSLKLASALHRASAAHSVSLVSLVAAMAKN